MFRIVKPTIVFLFLLSYSLFVTAQDSSGLKGWLVESRKIADGKYELNFTLPSTAGWQVYAPNQVLLEVKTTELRFADSSYYTGN